MNPFLVAGLILLAIVLTLVATKLLAGRKTPAIVAKVEAELAADGWELLQRTVAAVASDAAKKQAVTNATDDLAAHYVGVRRLKAAVAALPEA